MIFKASQSKIDPVSTLQLTIWVIEGHLWKWYLCMVLLHRSMLCMHILYVWVHAFVCDVHVYTFDSQKPAPWWFSSIISSLYFGTRSLAEHGINWGRLAGQQALRIWLSLSPPFSSRGDNCALLLSLASLHGYWDQTQISMLESKCFAPLTISPAPSNTNKDKRFFLNHTVLFLET